MNVIPLYNKSHDINDQIRDEKLHYNINREAALSYWSYQYDMKYQIEISDWSSGKIHKYEYLNGEDILSSN